LTKEWQAFSEPPGVDTENIENGCILNFPFFVEHEKSYVLFFKKLSYIFLSLHLGVFK